MNENEFDNHLRKAFVLQERKYLKEHLQDVEQRVNAPKKTNWLLVASIALLFGFAGYFYVFTSPTNDELFNTYNKPYENVVAPIVRNQQDISNTQKAFLFYENGYYEKAIQSFQQLEKSNNIDAPTLSFYKANTYLQLENFEKAKSNFASALTNNSTEWKQESLWYLALIAIKQNNNKAAKDYLQQLRKVNSDYKKDDVEKILNFVD